MADAERSSYVYPPFVICLPSARQVFRGATLAIEMTRVVVDGKATYEAVGRGVHRPDIVAPVGSVRRHCSPDGARLFRLRATPTPPRVPLPAPFPRERQLRLVPECRVRPSGARRSTPAPQSTGLQCNGAGLVVRVNVRRDRWRPRPPRDSPEHVRQVHCGQHRFQQHQAGGNGGMSRADVSSASVLARVVITDSPPGAGKVGDYRVPGRGGRICGAGVGGDLGYDPGGSQGDSVGVPGAPRPGGDVNPLRDERLICSWTARVPLRRNPGRAGQVPGPGARIGRDERYTVR